MITNNWGGHIPNVRDDCTQAELRFKHMETIWLDSGICQYCPEKPCIYFKNWKQELKEIKRIRDEYKKSLQRN